MSFKISSSILPFRKFLRHPAVALSALLLAGLGAEAATLPVGPMKTYATPCQAVASAVAGDVIEIDASGNYAGDVCYIGQNNLTLRGVNGRPRIDANGRNASGKGTWVIGGSGVVVDNVELSGSTVPDGNGAGIRYEGTNLTIRNSYFHNNEMGILSNAGATTEILIENSEFAFNGSAVGPGHNIYIGNIKKFTLRSSYSHDAVIGHLVKSRAQENYVLYNRLSATQGGSVSYEVNFPNGGTSYVIGNIIHQPSSNGNGVMVAYGEEGMSNSGHDLYVVNNSFVNDQSSGGTIVNLASGTTGKVQNNIFGGPGTAIGGAGAAGVQAVSNYQDLNPQWVNRAQLDLRPAAGAVFIDQGTSPGVSATGFSLTPTLQYVHVARSEQRPVVGALDIGAYEYATATSPTPEPAPAPTPTPSPDTTAPTVSITAPANGATVPRGSVVTITAAASDNVAVQKVEIYANGQLVCTDSVAPYSCSLSVTGKKGFKYTLQAKASDAAGNVGTSSNVLITTSSR